jgi:hypothetical protein
VTTWADVAKGDGVKLGGAVWIVQKVKPKGKRVKVTVERNGQVIANEVRAKDDVTLVGLHDAGGRQQRWAKQPETLEAEDRRERSATDLAAGDPSVTKPPRPAIGDPWETPADRIERKLDKILGARLVAETPDEAQGYYVPPVDVSTVAAHLVMFHARDHEQALTWRELGVDDMLELHRDEHAAALEGPFTLAVNHWHTEARPARVAS